MTTASPLPRERIPWIATGLISFQVFLATLAVAGIVIFQARVDSAATTADRMWLVQIAADSDEAGNRLAAQAVALLQAKPEVEHAAIVSRTAVEQLVAPWFDDTLVNGLPLPVGIDIRIRPGAAVTTETFRDISAAIPEISLHGYDALRDPLRASADTIFPVAVALVVLVGVATAGTVVLTTRSKLDIHGETISLLHTIGTEERYIARLFANRALVTGGIGGILGTVAGGLVVLGVTAAMLSSDDASDAGLSANGQRLASLFLLPVCAAVVSFVTAWLTVIARLRTA